MNLPRLETIVFAIALVVLVLDAGGGPGWNAASTHAVLAARLDHLAAAPLYDVLASVAALVPVGELGFRLGLLDAALAALTLAGVVGAVRALVPRELGAALVAVGLLLVAPAFRDAAAFATPAILAACGAVWSVACAARHAREPADARDARDAVTALLACAVTVGAAPWLGAAFTIAIVAWLWRSGARDVLAFGLGAVGLLAIVLWLDAAGSIPGAEGNLTATIATSGRGAAAIVVGAGLLGIGFGALTALPGARWLAVLVLIAGAHDVIVGRSAPTLLALLAIGTAIVASAIVRAAQPRPSGQEAVGTRSMTRGLEGTRRHALAAATGLPLVAIAAGFGGTLTVDDPRAAPTELATDLTASIPAGPGVFVTRRGPTWFALQYEAVIAGARPDLTIVPPLPDSEADAIVANALRAGRIAAADSPAFGRLNVQLARPRGRGFQLVGEAPTTAAPVSGPAPYASSIGREQAVVLALERARHEVASQHLDIAARALGLESRFGAADLAILATTLATPERPALFPLLPLDVRPAGPWLYDIFGDDLAWIAGLAIPAVDEHAPIARQLHAKWRAILEGKLAPDDPSIRALGPRAVAATTQLFIEKK